MTSREFSEITLWLADLEVFRKTKANRVVGPGGLIPPSLVLSTSFALHWMLEVRGRCYEITKLDYNNVGGVEGLALLKTPCLKQWKRARRQLGRNYECRIVGATNTTTTKFPGKQFHDGHWSKWKNCQNFVHLLHQYIAVRSSTILRSLDTSEWQRMPDPASTAKETAIELGLTAGIMMPTAVFCHYADSRGIKGRHVVMQHPGLTLAGAAITGLGALALALHRGDPDKLERQRLKAQRVMQMAVRYAPLADPLLFDDLRAKPVMYCGYNMENVNVFVALGFEVSEVVAAFRYLQLSPNGGTKYDFPRDVTQDILLVLFEFANRSSIQGRQPRSSRHEPHLLEAGQQHQMRRLALDGPRSPYLLDVPASQENYAPRYSYRERPY